MAATERFEVFLKDIGVQTRLGDAGISAADVDSIAEDVVRISFGTDGRLAGRPPIDRDDLKAILRLAL